MNAPFDRDQSMQVMRYDAERIVDEVIQAKMDRTIYQLISKRVNELREEVMDYVDGRWNDAQKPSGEVRYFGGSLIHNRQDSSSIDFLQSGTGATATTVQGELRNIPSVTQFGASTSASAATNTTAFNNAIAAHSVIFVPGAPGDIYDLNALNTITTAKIIWGQGATLRFNTTSDAITFNVSTVSPGQSSRYIVKGLQFSNLTNTPSSFIKSGSSGSGSVNALIEECQFSQCAATYCIDNAIGYGMKIRNCVFNDITGSAIRFQDSLNQATTYSFVASIDGCDITRPSGDGILIQGAQVLGISNTVIQGCAGAGIITKTNTTQAQAWNIHLNNVYFETNTGTDLDFSDSSSTYWTRAVLTGCSFIGSPTIALGTKSKVTIIASENGGGNTCTISGSSNASALIIGSSGSYTQSGTFNWTVIDPETNQTSQSSFSVNWGADSVNPGLGNGTLVSYYERIGNQVFVDVSLTIGSTTAFGTGSWFFSALPFTANAHVDAVGACEMYDSSANTRYAGTARVTAGAGSVRVNADTVTGDGVSATAPFTWATSDTLKFSVCYNVG